MKRPRPRHDIDPEKLITLVEAREILWDANARGHRSKHLIEENWKEIGEELGSPVLLLRKKWKNMKDQFRKEYKKDFTDWHFFNRLSFMSSQFPSRESNDDNDANAEGSDEDDARRNKKYKKDSLSVKQVTIDVNRLIELVQVREPIWDRDDRRHHNPYKLDECWQEVANELGCSILQARNKWKHLRDSLRRELKKSESDWIHFQKLSFLYPQFSQMSFFPDEGEDDEEAQQINEESMTAYYEDENRNSDDESYLDNGDQKPVIAEFADPEGNGSDGDNSPVPTMTGQLMDEDVGFFNSLLPHVKKLESDKKMALRMKIQELVYNSVYGN